MPVPRFFGNLLDVRHDVPDHARCERKYILPVGPGRRADAMVQRRLPPLARQHPARTVSSIYFDTATYACYQQSNAGVSRRLKLRLRWYGELDPSSMLSLELKHRANSFGWKQVHRIGSLDLAGLEWPALRAELVARAGPEARVALDVLCVPVLVTSYRRQYFHAPERGLRVTIDTELRFFDQRLRAGLNLTFDQTRIPFAIVEGKADRTREAEGVRLLRALGLRQTRFSKYCRGVDSFTRRR